MTYTGFRVTGRNATLTRPDDKPQAVAGSTWARDRSSLTADDGTELDATFVNRLRANLENFVAGLGGELVLAEGDHQLIRAMQSVLLPLEALQDTFDEAASHFGLPVSSPPGGSSLRSIVNAALEEIWSRATPGTLETSFKIKLDNGSDDVIPTTDIDGWINLKGHLKLFVDLDGDTDYDADFYSKDNAYYVAGGGIHLRPNFIVGAAEQGRVVVKAQDFVNFIQSARNYSGSTRNDLAFSDYNSTDPWLFFDQSAGGFAGVGFLAGEVPTARLHLKDSGATISVVESRGSTTARVGFKGTGTTGNTTVTVGASGDDLYLRAGGSDRAAVKSTGDTGIGTLSPTTKLHVNGPIRCGSFTVATVPVAGTVGAGTIIYVSNESGGAVPAFSDGTDWRRFTDRAVIS